MAEEFSTEDFSKQDAVNADWTREDLSGSTDGAKTDFSLTDRAVPGLEQVFLNGSLQQPDGDQDSGSISNDYVIEGNSIKFGSAPAGADTVQVVYPTF